MSKRMHVCLKCRGIFEFAEYVEKREPNKIRLIPVCPKCGADLNIQRGRRA